MPSTPQAVGLDMTIPDNVRVLILGSANVGKSALAVRFMTKRFIGFYESSGEECFYTHQTSLDGRTCPVEILDTPDSQTLSEEQLEKYVRWGTVVLIVYSIEERASFDAARQTLGTVSRLIDNTPVMLVANKTDLAHRREVGMPEVLECVRKHDVLFSEVSVALSSSDVTETFHSAMGVTHKFSSGRFTDANGNTTPRSKLSSKRRKTSFSAISRVIRGLVSPGQRLKSRGDSGSLRSLTL